MVGPVNKALEAARLFAAIQKKQYPRRIGAISKIWNAAIVLLEEDKPITAAAVGRLASEIGGPNGHSIRKNASYSKLVKMIAQVKERPTRRTRNHDEDLLNAISNQSDRSRVRQIIEERDELRKQISWLKKAVREDIYQGQIQSTQIMTKSVPVEFHADTAPVSGELSILLENDFWENLDCRVERDGVYLSIVRIFSREALDSLASLLKYHNAS